MRKSMVTMALVGSVLLCGCGDSQNKAEFDVSAALETLYQNDFSYIREDDDVVYTGEYTANPYEEHILVEGSSLYDEVYYYNENGSNKAKIHTKDGWIEQETARSYFYGYGEVCTILSEKETTLDGMACVVYETLYEIPINDAGIAEEALNAKIEQEYYVQKNDGKIIQIVTDLTDLEKMVSIANDMMTNGTLYEDAKQNAENANDFMRTEIVRIQYESAE